MFNVGCAEWTERIVMVATAIYNYWSDDITGRGAQSKKGPEGVGWLQGIHRIQHGRNKLRELQWGGGVVL